MLMAVGIAIELTDPTQDEGPTVIVILQVRRDKLRIPSYIAICASGRLHPHRAPLKSMHSVCTDHSAKPGHSDKTDKRSGEREYYPHFTDGEARPREIK